MGAPAIERFGNSYNICALHVAGINFEGKLGRMCRNGFKLAENL